MKRFVDMREALSYDEEPNCTDFAWFDTAVDRFEEHSGNMTWDSFQDFEADYKGDEIQRYRRLTPKWALND